MRNVGLQGPSIATRTNLLKSATAADRNSLRQAYTWLRCSRIAHDARPIGLVSTSGVTIVASPTSSSTAAAACLSIGKLPGKPGPLHSPERGRITDRRHPSSRGSIPANREGSCERTLPIASQI